MDDFRNIDEILDFAIAEEMGAYRFYTDLAGTMKVPAMQKALTDFAQEELGHKAKLESMRQGGSLSISDEKVADLKLSEILTPVEVSEKMDYQEVLVVAMKKEKAAFLMYTMLAEICEDAAIRDAFLAMAMEEAKHKLRFEVEYDDQIMKEN